MGEGDWMVVEADEATAPSSSCRPTSPSSPTSTPSTSTTTARSTPCSDAFRAFVENVPFYGFAVMCTRPSGGAGAGRRSRGPPHHHLRRQSAGRRARCVDVGHRDGRLALRRAVPRPRRQGRRTTDRQARRCRCRASTTCSNATAAIAVARELGIADDDDPQRPGELRRRQAPLHHSRRMERRRHHRRLRPPSGRDRRGAQRRARACAKGRVIAVVQPHRYTRLQDLVRASSRTCFNDADTVIVADVYPAGEAPIEGADRDHLVQALRARGHRHVIPLDGPEKLAGIDRGPGQARRLRGLPRRRLDHAMGLCAAGRVEGAMSFPDIVPDLKARMPELRGRLLANQPLERRSPGSASAARRRCCSCRPTRTTWRYFLRNLAGRDSGDGDRRRLQPDRARRRHPGRGDPARRAASARSRSRTAIAVARRHRRARRHGRARGARCRHRRAGVPSRHSRHDRRRAAHERRRLRRRDQGRADRGARRRPRRAMSAPSAMPRWAFPIATAACPTTSSSPARCSRAAPAMPAEIAAAMAEIKRKREASQPQEHDRRLDLQEPARRKRPGS